MTVPRWGDRSAVAHPPASISTLRTATTSRLGVIADRV
jgi:hypothetical protein